MPASQQATNLEGSLILNLNKKSLNRITLRVRWVYMYPCKGKLRMCTSAILKIFSFTRSLSGVDFQQEEADSIDLMSLIGTEEEVTSYFTFCRYDSPTRSRDRGNVDV